MVIWSIVGLGIAAAITVVSRERQLAGPYDLGPVSAQWIAEHRDYRTVDWSR